MKNAWAHLYSGICPSCGVGFTETDRITLMEIGPTEHDSLFRHAVVHKACQERAEPLSMFTEQELRVGQLVAAGMPGRAIARRMGLGPSTVKGKLRQIYRKLNVASQVKVALYFSRAMPAAGKAL